MKNHSYFFPARALLILSSTKTQTVYDHILLPVNEVHAEVCVNRATDHL